MRKMQKTSELLWVMGILFVALGVSICSKADLGVSMLAALAFVIYDAVAPFWSGFSVGVAEYLMQGMVLAVLCVVVRRFNWRYLLTFAVAVVYGYTMNMFLWLLRDVSFGAVWLRWVMLIVGDTITAFGVACFFRTYLPLQVHELFVAEIVARFGLNLNKTKWLFDLSFLGLSLFLALTLFGDAKTFDWSSIAETSFHSIGLGTLLTTAINSPLIAVMGKFLDRVFEPSARFPKLERLLKRN